jgi:hypothetical protein
MQGLDRKLVKIIELGVDGGGLHRFWSTLVSFLWDPCSGPDVEIWRLRALSAMPVFDFCSWNKGTDFDEIGCKLLRREL